MQTQVIYGKDLLSHTWVLQCMLVSNKLFQILKDSPEITEYWFWPIWIKAMLLKLSFELHRLSGDMACFVLIVA